MRDDDGREYRSPVLDPRLGRGPGLARLRAHPDAERIRLGVVDRQELALARAGHIRKEERIMRTDETSKLGTLGPTPTAETDKVAAATTAAPEVKVAAPKPAPKPRAPAKPRVAAPKTAATGTTATPEAKPAADAKTTTEGGPVAKAKKSKFTGKTKAEKKVAKPKSSRAAFPDMAKINILVEGNPRREGSKKHAAFEILRKCKGQTVKTYREKGGSDSFLRRAVKRKHAEVTTPPAKL